MLSCESCWKVIFKIWNIFEGQKDYKFSYAYSYGGNLKKHMKNQFIFGKLKIRFFQLMLCTQNLSSIEHNAFIAQVP